ncbi:MAG: hypothetical protein O2884_05220 [Chloroflexi bacterium]|nr:hypothetical protein [Chloroflexota bacterium]
MTSHDFAARVRSALDEDAALATRELDVRLPIRRRLTRTRLSRSGGWLVGARIAMVVLAAMAMATTSLVLYAWQSEGPAVAGWNTLPDDVDPALLEVAADCGPGSAAGADRPPLADGLRSLGDASLIIVDQRGVGAVAMATVRTQEYMGRAICIYGSSPDWPEPGWRFLGGGAGGGPRTFPLPPGLIDVPPADAAWLTGGGSHAGRAESHFGTTISYAAGLVGDNVARVAVHPKGRPAVVATVADGWFMAWWPTGSSWWPFGSAWSWWWITETVDITIEAFGSDGSLLHREQGGVRIQRE